MAYTGTSVAGGEGNTTFAPLNLEFLGKDLEFVTIDYNGDVSTKTAKDSAIDKTLKTVQGYANLVGMGPLVASDNEQTFIIEGVDQFVGAPASAGGSFTLTTTTAGSSVGTLQTAIQALGTVDSINLGSATAIRGGPSAALEDAIA